MRRSEFIDSINSWYDLISFCEDEDCDICEDVYSEEERDDYINERLEEIARGHNLWWELKEELENIPEGDGYYRFDGITEWAPLDDYDFDEYKSDVVRWMDDGEYWDEEEDDEFVEDDDSIDEDIDEEDLMPIEPEDISVSDLFVACNKGLKSIADADLKAERAEENNFEEFVAGIRVTSVTAERG